LFEASEMFSTDFELFGLEGPSRVIARGPDVIAVGAPITLGESEITIAVSSPLQPVRDSIDRVREGLLLSVPLLVLAIAFATWLIVGRALRPVEAMTARVDRITAESLDQRVPQPVGRDELSHLASTMNKMLARLQTSRDAQRQFISDASHELRSPITATQATLEVAQRDPDNVDWHKTSGVLFDENLRLAGLVDDLLLSASLDEAPLGTDLTEVDLDEVCISEAARPHPCEVHVRVESPARVRANLGHVTRAVRNLVDNAARHATTRVDVVVASIDGFGVIEIVDDGPGIAPESLNVIFERFTRLDESRHRASTSEARRGGAGLGLAITRQIAQAHGGSVTAENRPDDSGARLTLQLPIEVDSVRGSRGTS
jgi:signal transduction histidine kinase